MLYHPESGLLIDRRTRRRWLLTERGAYLICKHDARFTLGPRGRREKFVRLEGF